jgi:DNA polymerase-3 subunit alpha
MNLCDIPKYEGLPFHGVKLPTYDITPAQCASVGAPAGCGVAEFIRHLCRVGWTKKIARKVPKEKWETYRAQIVHELDVIETLGFTNYILMVYDICRFADEAGIPRGPGRGSVGGSCVSYLLNITDIDPIEGGLFFTRFLSKSRAKTTVVDGITYVDGGLVADVDMDFGYYRRQEVIDYINQRYPGQTSQLLTVRTLSSRILIKDLLKVYENMSEHETKLVSDMMEDDAGIPVPVEKALLGDDKFQKGEESKWPPNEQFKEWASDHMDVVNMAMDLEGLNIGEGMHPSAVAICAMPINELMPTQLSVGQDGKVSVSGYDMYDAQEIALKFDILGLKCLDVLNDCAKVTGIDWRTIDVHDPVIYQFLQDFKYRYGIFQLETWAQGTAAQKVKPKNFDQLSAVLAIARPGAIAYLDQFSKYVNEGTFAPIHPLIDDILKPTGGVCCFQEQALAMLVKVGLTADEAEFARKCVAKDTKFVSKTRGWISIEKLLKDGYKDDLFLVMDEVGKQQWKKITNIWSNGTKQVEYVRARNGMWVRATGWHQFLTAEGWKAKRYLDDSDYLVCAKSVEYDGEDKISFDMAMVIAGLVTEGYFVGKMSFATFVNWDKELMDRFVASFKNVFGDRLHMKDDYRTAVIRVKEKNLIGKLMFAGKSNVKKLPEEMMGMTKESTAKILGFMFACEATVTDLELSFTSASYRLIQQIQLLLLRFGVRSNLIKKFNEQYDKFYYTLHIGQHDDIVRFMEGVGQYMSAPKVEIVMRRISVEKVINHTTDVIPATIMKRFVQQYGLNPEDGGRAYSHNVSMHKFRRIAEESKDKQWITFANGKQEYTKVESLNELYDRETEVFDFTVDEDTPFIIANGLVIHNCVGKKLKEKIPEVKAKISEVCKVNNHPPKITDLLLQIIEASGGYAFNNSHSRAYAKLVASTLYYKSKCPLQFYWANLQMIKGESERYEKLEIVAQEMRQAGYTLLPPRLSLDGMDFKIEGDKSIRCALGMVRGISEENEAKLAMFIGKSGLTPASTKFEVFQAMKNAKLNVAVGSALIQAGCMEGYDVYTNKAGQTHKSRSRLVLEFCLWSKSDLLNDRERGHCLKIEKQVNSDVLQAVLYLAQTARDDKGHPIIKESRFATLKKRYEPYKEIYLQNSTNERLANFWYEKYVLGFSHSESLRGIFSEYTDGLISTSEAKTLPEGSHCRLIGFINKPYRSKTQKGNAMLSFSLNDEVGEARVKAFNERIDYVKEQNGRLPEESDIAIVNCKKMSGGVFFAEAGIDGTIIGIQTCKVFLKLAELRDSKAEKETPEKSP